MRGICAFGLIAVVACGGGGGGSPSDVAPNAGAVTITASNLNPEAGDEVTVTAIGAAEDAGAPTWTVEPAERGRVTAEGVFLPYDAGKVEVVVSYADGKNGRLAFDVRAANPATFGEGVYLGSNDNDVGEDVVIDTDGSFYIVGGTGGFVDSFGAGGNAFVTRILPNGREAWTRFIPMGQAAGNIALVPNVGGVIVSTTVPGLTQIARLDRGGTIVWNRDLPLGNVGLTVTSTGDVWATGFSYRRDGYLNEAFLGPVIGENLLGSADGFVLHLDATGNTIAGKHFNWSFTEDVEKPLPAFFAYGVEIAVDEAARAVVIAGTTIPYPKFGSSAFVRRFDFSLNEQWVRHINKTGVAMTADSKDWNSNTSKYIGGQANVLALGSDGTAYVGGAFDDANTFVSAIAPDGSEKWRTLPPRTVEGTETIEEVPTGLVYRPQTNDLIVARSLNGSIFDREEASGAMLFTVIGPTGTIGATKNFGGLAYEAVEPGIQLTLRGMTVTPSGDVFATGSTVSSFFGQKTVPGPTFPTSLDAIVFRITPL